MGSRTPSSDDLSPVLEGGFCHCKDLLMAYVSPNIIIMQSITTVDFPKHHSVCGAFVFTYVTQWG